ncbi:hypothetical protein ABKN59_010186 [Abortiporus biennis]
MPLSASFPKSRYDYLPIYNSHHHSRHHYRSRIDILKSRARITNLGFLLLSSFAALSFLFNLSYYLSSPHNERTLLHHPHSILATIDRDRTLLGLNHLIIVPGHAIWKGSNPDKRLDDDEWILEPYQRGGGRVAAFVKHIETGADLAMSDDKSLLVFSGGQTRRTSTLTEGESYLNLALSAGFLPNKTTTSLRATTEEHALDSYQNLLFSIARFHEYTGNYPTKITIVGYEMKRRRFTELHRAAIRWPRQKFHYVGIDAEGEELVLASEGEKQNGYLPYSKDIYGCHEFLQSKRKSRNPFVRYHSYYTSAPELGPLLNWCPGSDVGGETTVFHGPLPWDISS